MAISRMADVHIPDIDELRMAGVEMGGLRHAVGLNLTGDYSFMSSW